jgi:hypothetical protein
MKIGYFDCICGAAGDMIVAAMLDGGLDPKLLKDKLDTLGIGKFELKISKTTRCGLSATHFEPLLPKEHTNRNLKQIKEIISQSGISKPAKAAAVAVFENLAKAEAAVHRKRVDEIHFHEVGALDSIVDIVGAAVGMHGLGIEKAYCSVLPVGGGTVKCAHGVLPVPGPATAELLKGVPICGGPIQAELVTPTGAAILKTVVSEFGTLPGMVIERIGYGAGTMDPPEVPNVVRLIIGQAASNDKAEADTVCVLETNIDDATGEVVGFAMEYLLEAGALDVYTTAILMKQNRPAIQLTVICRVEDEQRIQQAVFTQGLTFGIRRRLVQRAKLARESVRVATEYGEIDVKTGFWDGKIVAAKPEFMQCAEAAKTHHVAVKTVMAAALSAWRSGQRGEGC